MKQQFIIEKAAEEDVKILYKKIKEYNSEKVPVFKGQKVIQKLRFKFECNVRGLPEGFDFYNGEPFYSLKKGEYLQKTGYEGMGTDLVRI